MTGVVGPIGGWSHSGWGKGPWNYGGYSENVGGVAGTGIEGSVSVDAEAVVYVTEVQAAMTTGGVLVYGEIIPQQNANWTPIAA